jgi:hypothetical protein
LLAGVAVGANLFEHALTTPLRSIERSNTLTDQYPKDGHFEKTRRYQNNSRR